MAAQRLQNERELIDRQAAATSAAAASQAEAAHVLPSEIHRLVTEKRCTEAADTTMRGGEIDLAQQSRAYCQ